tara:strand:- start:1248 stop:1847 length:600 start_codon:yes stop_codon:yes gene_type:complete
MYSQHQPMIQNYARTSITNWNHTATFVVATIRIRLVEAVEAHTKLVKTGSINPRVFFGFKNSSLDYLNSFEGHNCARWALAEDNPATVVAIYSRIPGLDIVKAGFLATLTHGVGGCLDSHNIKLYNLKPRSFRTHHKMLWDTRLAHADRYIKLCDKLGGTEKIWDNWCSHIAAKYPQTYKDGGEVSQFHTHYIEEPPAF